MYIVYEGVRADEVRVAEYHFCAQPKAKRLRCVSGECAEHRAFVFSSSPSQTQDTGRLIAKRPESGGE